jgi:hypothetical protein
LPALLRQNSPHTINEIAPNATQVGRILNIVVAQPMRNFLAFPQIFENCEEAN